MTSRFVQITVAPTGTVTVCGPKLKLSIFISPFAPEDWSIAGFRGTNRDNPTGQHETLLFHHDYRRSGSGNQEGRELRPGRQEKTLAKRRAVSDEAMLASEGLAST